MKPIRCVVVDDEPPAMRQISGYIGKIPELQLCAAYTNPIEALSYLSSNQIDILFLDIRMDHLSGIQMIGMMKHPPRIILTTAYDSYALEAFQLRVDDYLLKPVSFERFVLAVDRIQKGILLERRAMEQEEFRKTNTNEYFFIRTENRIQRVNFGDILYIQGLKEYLIIRLAHQQYYTLQTFAEILQKLPPNRFIRVHKSFVVSLEKIDFVKKNQIHIGTHVIPIGLTYRDVVLQAVGK